MDNSVELEILSFDASASGAKLVPILFPETPSPLLLREMRFANSVALATSAVKTVSSDECADGGALVEFNTLLLNLPLKDEEAVGEGTSRSSSSVKLLLEGEGVSSVSNEIERRDDEFISSFPLLLLMFPFFDSSPSSSLGLLREIEAWGTVIDTSPMAPFISRA